MNQSFKEVSAPSPSNNHDSLHDLLLISILVCLRLAICNSVVLLAIWKAKICKQSLRILGWFKMLPVVQGAL